MSLSSVIHSFVVVLSVVGYTTAQIPLGVSMVPNPVVLGNSDPAPPYPSDSNPSYNSPAPSYPYPSYSGSDLSSMLPVQTGSPAYGSPPSQYTPPPSPPSESSYPYQQMPYSSFTNGGYSQMDCGYGYQKGSNGKCTPQSWVCSFLTPCSRKLAWRTNPAAILEFVLIGFAFSSGVIITLGVVIRQPSSSTTNIRSKSARPLLLSDAYLIPSSRQYCPPPSTVTVTDKSIETMTLTVTCTEVFFVAVMMSPAVVFDLE